MNHRPKILCVLGTRPEAIKFAPVIRALDGIDSPLRSRVCSTNQHAELLDQALQIFSFHVDYELGAMKCRQTPSDVAARVLKELPDVLAREKPVAVLTQGDTTTCFAASLAAFYARIPVGHIEAGLRTYNIEAPFPEEANRQMVSRLATWHFAPTEDARDNLEREGVAPDSIVVTGNTVVDALLWCLEILNGDKATPRFNEIDAGMRLILTTCHRRENFGEPMRQICHAIRAIVEEHEDVIVVFPVHLNPEVRDPVGEILGQLDRVRLLPPVDYLTLVDLMRRSHLILTDSGGVQEEAPVLGKPVALMREATERPEGMDAGTTRLVGATTQRIVMGVSEILLDVDTHRKMSRVHMPYGDGQSARRILERLRADLL